MHLSPDLRLSPILDPRCYFSAVSPPYITPPHHPTVPYTRSTPGYKIQTSTTQRLWRASHCPLCAQVDELKKRHPNLLNAQLVDGRPKLIASFGWEVLRAPL
ncbi:hypothetical protein PAPYR_1025 [Paratrimastix pyriformis]|uniref:Uncharacterized protein n=1 Tax=Paratrimastix pyriformis TaxID=342808 RepID=A0ABQ8UVB3_9EUKA|nr:hypothetical protein PAPYR_1025 [Paratrimastix pyriformis]